MKKLLASAWISAALMMASGGAQADIQEGRDYTVLVKPIPQKQAEKIEVLEFFGYFCPHCMHLDPILQKHEKVLAPDTYVRKEHVIWQDDMVPLAQLAAAVNATNLHAEADGPIFDAYINKKTNLSDTGTLKTWAASQPFGAKLMAAYAAPAAKTEADAMKSLTEEYKIASTPTVIVGGKYQVKMEDFEQSMGTIDALIDKMRQERHMPAQAARAMATEAKSKGAEFALAANQ